MGSHIFVLCVFLAVSKWQIYNYFSTDMLTAEATGQVVGVLGDQGKVHIRVLCSFYNKTFEANSSLLYCQRGSGYF